jgi:hypothetical protein
MHGDPARPCTMAKEAVLSRSVTDDPGDPGPFPAIRMAQGARKGQIEAIFPPNSKYPFPYQRLERRNQRANFEIPCNALASSPSIQRLSNGAFKIFSHA